MIGLLLATAMAAPVDVRVLQHGDATPLSDAEITVDGEASLTTGADGRLELELTDGPHVLLLSTINHRPATVELVVPLDGPLRVFLHPLSAPGEIVVEAFRPTADLSRHVVDAEMAFETPGTYDDAVRLVASLPGVNVQREYSPSAGEVSVRGSLPGDNRTFLDGIEVPYLYHFNQYASVFPASQLDQLELFSSTFGPRYGDAVGAVIEAVSRTDRPEAVTGSAMVNFVMVGADVRAPVSPKWWVSVGARRSYQDLVTRETAQFPLWPSFYDFTVRAQHEDDRGRQTGLFAAGAGDRYERIVGELDILDPWEATTRPTIDHDRGFQLVGASHRWKLGRMVGAVLHDHSRAEVEAIGHDRQRSVGVPMRLDLGDDVSTQVRWEAGAEVRPQWSSLDLTDAGLAGPLVTRESPAMTWGEDVVGSRLRLQAAAYSTVHLRLGRLRLMPGLRVGVDSSGWAPLIEPRLAMRLRVADQTELRVSGGRFQQRPDDATLQVFPDLPTTDSWQVGLGIDQTVVGRLEISAEGYYKHLSHVLFQPPDGPPEVFDTGAAYGAELAVRYRMRETLFLWGWFAWSRSTVEADGSTLSTVADQPFAGGFVLSWNVLPRFNVALRYRGATGLPYTPIEGSAYDATRDAWSPRYQTAYSARLPGYHKVDLHLAYTFPFKRWSLALSADLWFVPPQSAQLYPTWNHDFTEQDWVKGPVLFPLLGLRATF